MSGSLLPAAPHIGRRSSRRRYALAIVVGLLAICGLSVLIAVRSESISALKDETERAFGLGEEDRAAELVVRLRKLLERSATSGDDAADAWKLVAEIDAAQGRTEAAISAWEQVARNDPALVAEAAWQQGSLALRAFQGGRAEAFLREAVRLRPDDSRAWRLLAQLHGVLGESTAMRQALGQLARLLAATADDLEVLAASNAFVSDEATVDRLLAAEPDNHRPLLARLRTALNAERNDEAFEIASKLVAAEPENVEAQAFLGRLLAEKSSREFLDWQARLPETIVGEAAIWITRGLWLRAQGELQPAIRCFHEAVLREPDNISATNQLAEALRMRAEQPIADQMAARVGLLRDIVSLAQRYGERPNPGLIRQLVPRLDHAGRYWEARAWADLYLRLTSRPVDDDPQVARDRDQRARNATVHADIAAVPGRDLDWSRAPLPVWSRYVPRESLARPEVSAAAIRFSNEAAALGVDFRYRNSDDTGTPGRRIFESTGGGVAIADFDRNGWPDLYWTQGGPWPIVRSEAPVDRLFLNRGDPAARTARFADVTAAAGLDERAFSQGPAAGDLDSDGFPDLYIANIGRNTLYRNLGDGTFLDLTASAGLDETLWTVSAAIADLNGDGHSDLFDVNYLQGEAIFTTICVDEKERPRVCRPSVFEPAPDTLWLGSGDGTLTACHAEAGLDIPNGMGLGLVVGQFNDDLRPDIFIANDQTPNFLLINESADRSGPLPASEASLPIRPRFVERGIELGCALDRDGFAQACMGIASGDVNRDGRLDLFVTNFAQESNTLYLSQAGGAFEDATRQAGLRAPSFELLGFGTQFLDADNDGWLDLFVANGHIDEFTHLNQDYRMRSQMFRGLADGRFQELLAPQSGPFFAEPRLGRGVAIGDFDCDGRADLAVSDLETDAAVLINDSPAAGYSIALELVGTRSARDAVGARVRVRIGEREQWGQRSAGSGYEATNESLVRFGTGASRIVDLVEVVWPDGEIQRFEALAADEHWVIRQGASPPLAVGPQRP